MSVVLILLQLFSFCIIPGPPRLAIAYICSARTPVMPSEFPSFSDFPFFSSHLLELQAGFANMSNLLISCQIIIQNFCSSVQLVTTGVYDSRNSGMKILKILVFAYRCSTDTTS